VCFFVRSTISRQPAGRFTPKFACGRTVVPDVSSPLLGVSGRRRGGAGNEIFVTRSQWGIFEFWRFLSDISATRGRIHAKFYSCRDNVFRRAPSPSAVHRALDGGRVKTQKMGDGLIRAADSYHFYFSQRCQMWFNM